jgi:hypothetical protein
MLMIAIALLLQYLLVASPPVLVLISKNLPVQSTDATISAQSVIFKTNHAATASTLQLLL